MEQQIEQLFKWIDETTGYIEKEENAPYIEALIASSNLLFEHELPNDLRPDYEKMLRSQLDKVDINNFDFETRRKAMQLAILKGMKGATQQHHYITPDTVGIFIGYLVQRFMEERRSFSIFDPACGTANLLLAVLNQQESRELQVYGSEVDPTLIQLAFNNTNLQERNIEFFHQDSLKPILLEPVDVVVSDLPVGYYPDDTTASGYELKSEEGHSLAHHLFIEQSVNYTKDGGYIFLVVPSFLFSSEQTDKLHTYLKEHTHIIGLLELPKTMFKDEKFSKSIFILQKQGLGTKNPTKALLAELPSFKDVKAMDNILIQFNNWFENER
ncbi:class I SAM-dependent methyltransferase [Bacillaceae bacterium W0354]